jgi:hypothetical protein
MSDITMLQAQLLDADSTIKGLREKIDTQERWLSGRLAEIDRLGDELDKDDATIKRLRKALESLRIKEHDEFDDDCWYACPKSGKCCDEDADKNKCTCGMDRINEIIDNALRGEE